MSEPLVSIIVPTKNSAAILPRLMDSIRAQNYKPIEVIVVDNHSTDGEPELVRTRYPEARFFTQGPERNVQRNFGARQARGEFVMFFDSDMELRPALVADCVRLAAEGADAVIIPEEGGGSGFWAECQKLEKRCYFNDPYMEAANRFIRLSAYWQVGGYNEAMIAGEDFELHDKLKAAGFKIARTGVALVHHEPAGFWSVVRKKFYYGSKMRDYFKSAGSTGVKRFAPLKPAFLRQWRLLARDPLHGLGLLVMKTTQWTAGLLGLALGCLKPRQQ
ncbi:MAG: glycosyltransferase [Verrucomicrobiia bacterium]